MISAGISSPTFRESSVKSRMFFSLMMKYIIGAGFGDSFFILISDSVIRNHEPQGSFFFIYDISKFL